MTTEESAKDCILIIAHNPHKTFEIKIKELESIKEYLSKKIDEVIKAKKNSEKP